jgi:hypothetical protein
MLAGAVVSIRFDHYKPGQRLPIVGALVVTGLALFIRRLLP